MRIIKILFSIAGMHFYFFGFMIAVGVLAAYWLVQLEAVRRGQNADKLVNLGILAVMGGFVGARLVYVVFYNPGPYLAAPLTILSLHQGGLSIHGGLLGGLIIGVIMARKWRLPVWTVADIFAPGLVMAQALGRIGCDVFGRPTTMPWGVLVGQNLLHPVQLYEFWLNLALFTWLWRRKRASAPGQLFLEYLAGFMVIRGVVEFFRINPTVLGGLSVSHLLSLVGLTAVAVVYFFVQRPVLDVHHSYNKDYSPAFVALLAIAGTAIYYLAHMYL